MSSRPVFEEYVEMFKDERTWHNTKKELLAYFESEKGAENMGLKNITSILSVGAGNGSMDLVLISQCPKLKEYVALEPDIGFHEDLNSTLQNFPSVKTETILTMFEDYYGQDQYFDAVFFIHSAYYFDERMEFQLRRAMDMLRSGGKLIIILGHSGPFYEACDKLSEKTGNVYDKWKDTIAKLDAAHSETQINMHFDFSHPGPMNHSIIDITMRRTATAEEKEIIMKELSHEFVPGTKCIKAIESVFVISKK